MHPPPVRPPDDYLKHSLVLQSNDSAVISADPFGDGMLMNLTEGQSSYPSEYTSRRKRFLFDYRREQTRGGVQCPV